MREHPAVPLHVPHLHVPDFASRSAHHVPAEGLGHKLTYCHSLQIKNHAVAEKAACEGLSRHDGVELNLIKPESYFDVPFLSAIQKIKSDQTKQHDREELCSRCLNDYQHCVEKRVNCLVIDDECDVVKNMGHHYDRHAHHEAAEYKVGYVLARLDSFPVLNDRVQLLELCFS